LAVGAAVIAVRSMMNLSLSFDHRALDGLAAARFLQQVKRWLEGVNEQVALKLPRDLPARFDNPTALA